MANVKGAFFLILALAMLLVGITFINNTFKNIKAKTGEAMELTEGALTPTKDDPLKLEYYSKSIRRGESASLTISFMNPASNAKYCQLSFYENDTLLEPESEDWLVYNHNPVSIAPEQISIWKAAIGDKENREQTKLLAAVVCCADSYEEGESVSCSAENNNGFESRKSI